MRKTLYELQVKVTICKLAILTLALPFFVHPTEYLNGAALTESGKEKTVIFQLWTFRAFDWIFFLRFSLLGF